MKNGRKNILFIGGSRSIKEEAEAILKREGYGAFFAKGYDDGMKALSEDKDSVSLVILDIRTLSEGGFSIYDRIKEIDPNLPVVTTSTGGHYRPMLGSDAKTVRFGGELIRDSGGNGKQHSKEKSAPAVSQSPIKRRAAFISPRGSESNQQNNILNTIYQKLMRVLTFVEIEDVEFMPNLGLLTIAAYMDDSWDVKYIEEDYVTPDQMQPLIMEEKYDLVCLSAVNSQALRAYRIASEFRKRGIYTVMGGLHASMLPDEAKEHVDTVIIGEGEDTFPQFLRDFDAGCPKPFYKSSGKADLTKVPMPRFDLIENITRFNKITIQATRGCPHSCDYCCIHQVYGPHYRKKAPSQVVAEIEEIKRLYPRPFISFADENLLVDHAYSKELLRAMIPCNIRWEGYCDISAAEDDELLQLLSDSGCILMMIGLETLNITNLKEVAKSKARFLEKQNGIDYYEQAVRKIQSFGVGVMGLFMLGFDHDTEGVFSDIDGFIRNTGMFDVDFAIVCPIPGTRLYHRWKEEGRITCEDWDHYAWYNVNYKPLHLSPEQLKEGIMDLFNRFNSPEEVARKKEHFQQIYRRLYTDETLRRKKLEQLGMIQYC